ncbi:MAG: methyltransferase domain-containing protein [Candidatus Latescibacterota bacterium]
MKTTEKHIDKSLKINKWMHFGGDVPKHFDEHVRKSIPNYERVMEKIGFVSQFFIENESSYLDIGSSTGRSVLEVVWNNRGKAMHCDVVDASQPMVDEMRKRFRNREKPKTTFNFVCLDVTKFFFTQKYDLIVASLVIQFIKKEIRQDLLKNIYDCLNAGGAFLWFEKCSEESAMATDIMKQYVNTYKQKSGLSPESVLNKDDSLRGIMPLRAYEDNYALLQSVGFTNITVMDKDMNFTLFMAIK